MFISGNRVTGDNSVSASQTTIQDLPNEIYVEIFKNLPLRDAASVSMTQKSWNVLQDMFENYAARLGFEGAKEESVQFLKNLFAEVKMACQNGDIPADFIIYQDAEKTTISCERTLLNLLTKEGVVETVFGVAHNPNDFKDEKRAIIAIHLRGYNIFKIPQRYNFLLTALLALSSEQEVMGSEKPANSQREAFVLAVATVTGCMDGIRLLLRWGVDVNSTYEGHIATPLSLAKSYAVSHKEDKEQHDKTAAFLEAHGGKKEECMIILG